MAHMEDRTGYQPRPKVKSADNGAREGCLKYDALDLALKRAGVSAQQIYEQECRHLGVEADPKHQAKMRKLMNDLRED